LAEEEVRKEIEELPEGGVELESARIPEGGEREEEVGGVASAGGAEEGEVAETLEAEEVRPVPSPREGEIEEKKKKLRELIETYRDVSSFVKDMRDLGPEERALVHSIVEKVLTPERVEPQVIEKPVVVEKPVEKVVEKPVPVVPETVERIGRKAEVALERIGAVEERLSRYEKALEELAEVQKDVAMAVKSMTSYVSENMRLQEELRKIREELENFKKQTEQKYMIIPKAEKLNPDGSVVREYDFHPALKAVEKRTDFAVEKLGPALIQELRATRSDISSSINRLVTLIEAVITPELRRRAPKLVEDIEEATRKLVGRLSPEERERTLTELESRLEELEKEASKEGGEK